MQSYVAHLLGLFDGPRKSFVIPVYQRRYSWKRDNCRQLLNDLHKISDKKTNHFFGSIVSISNNDGWCEQLQIVDGQQRITTVSLLLLAMYTLLNMGELVSEDPDLKNEIFDRYLTCSDDKGAKKLKLELSSAGNDQAVYDSLFHPDEKISKKLKASHLWDIFDFFCSELKKIKLTVDKLYAAVHRLKIIYISLTKGEYDPQLIFESLNSTGLALTEGDKIRNFMLMNMPFDKQEEYYKYYWSKIEEYCCIEEYCDPDISAFVHDYLSLNLNESPKLDKVYVEFKDYVEKSKRPVQDLLEELWSYACLWQILLKGEKSGSKELDRSITRLNSLTTVVSPFLLKVLYLKEKTLLSPEDTLMIFKLTESLLLRRAVCDLPSNSLRKIFVTMHKDIVNCSEDEENFVSDYVEKFKYILMTKRERGRSFFPTDEEFARAFEERDIYKMNRDFVKYIMERLENGTTKEYRPVLYDKDENKAPTTIEHIMPQTLSPDWKEALGEKYEQIHKKWLHRIANLTLTAYNSEYSNRSFSKKNSKNGFCDSSYRLNNWVATRERWTEIELENRSKQLKDEALKIWPYPWTDYQPPVVQDEYLTLDDDPDEFTKRKVRRVKFKDLDESVDKWSKLFETLLRCLYQQGKNIIQSRAQSAREEDKCFRNILSCRQEDLSKPRELGDGVYFGIPASTAIKLQILKRLFKLYKKEPSDVLIYLRPQTEKDNSREKDKNGGKQAPLVQDEYSTLDDDPEEFTSRKIRHMKFNLKVDFKTTR